MIHARVCAGKMYRINKCISPQAQPRLPLLHVSLPCRCTGNEETDLPALELLTCPRQQHYLWPSLKLHRSPNRHEPAACQFLQKTPLVFALGVLLSFGVLSGILFAAREAAGGSASGTLLNAAEDG